MRHFFRAKSPLPFAVSALTSWLAVTAHAQEVAATPSPANATELAPITVTASEENDTASYSVKQTTAATKLNLSLRDTPQSVSVITRERMDDQNMQSLRDVLDNTTGIYSFGYDTERTVFSTRGFVITNTLIDGVPTLTRSNTDSADASLDTALYDRIEVVRGATGLMTGAGNPSAAINLVRKHADSRESAGSVELSAGSWNDYRTVLDMSTALNESGSVRGRVVGVLQQSESYMDFYSNARDALYAVIDADLGASTTLSVGYDYQKTAPDAVSWGWFPLYFSDGSLANWPRSISTAANWSFWDNTSSTVFAELKQDLGKDWQLRATAQHRETKGDLALFFMDYYGGPSTFPDPVTGLGLLPAAYRSQESNTQDTLDVYASGPFQLFGRQHELVVGATGSRTRQDTTEFANCPAPYPLTDPLDPDSTDYNYCLASVGSLFNWDGNYPMPPFGLPSQIKQLETDQSGLYSALRLSLTDPLKLIAGARYSTWKVDGYDAYSETGTVHYKQTDITPYAGLIYDISSNLSAFVSYTGIFTPQNYQAPNGAYLDPISGISREVGIKGEHFDKRLNTALTLFDTRQDNVAAAMPGVFLPDGMTQAYAGVDGASSQGFELEVSGAITPDWNASLGWSYSKLEDADRNVLNSYIPHTLVRLFTSWKLPDNWSKLTIGGGANWQSSSNIEATCPSGVCNFSQKPVLVLNLMARYQFTPAFSAQLNADNLLDETYYVVGEYDSVNYAPPVNATLGLKYQL